MFLSAAGPSSTAQVSIATVTNTVRAALGMPAVEFGVPVAPAADPDSAEPQQDPAEPQAGQQEEPQPAAGGGY